MYLQPVNNLYQSYQYPQLPNAKRNYTIVDQNKEEYIMVCELQGGAKI